jgi:hypothetical protein
MMIDRNKMVFFAAVVLVISLIPTFFSAPIMADTLAIVSYSMENGEAGAQTYFDDTYGGPGATGNPNVAGSLLSGGLGQLTNGSLAVPPDIVEWIGWNVINPTITFDLGTTKTINSVSFHAANFSPGYYDIAAPGSANRWYSQDNVTFTSLGTYTTTVADRSGDDTRWVDIPFGATARYARVQLFDGVKIGGNGSRRPQAMDLYRRGPCQWKHGVARTVLS